MRSNSRYLVLTCVGVAILMAAAACGPPPKTYDTASGGDEKRDQAKSLFVGQNVTDNISDPQGDHTDWKQVRVREAGELSVTISIDNTRGMKGHVSIKDGFGVELERKKINPSDNLYTFDKLPVYQGEYYVEVFADTGESVYTAGAAFEALKKADVDRLRELDPPDKNPNWRPRDKTDNPVATRTRARRKEPTKEEVKEEVKEENVDNGPGTPITVTGTIVRIIPREDGGAILTIVGLGKGQGVVKGQSGSISELKANFTVTWVGPRSISALTKLEAETVKEGRQVKVTVNR